MILPRRTLFQLTFEQISVAVNGREALNMAARQKFDVVITDLRMP
jgi:YesN/AraC family two-component response regulator